MQRYTVRGLVAGVTVFLPLAGAVLLGYSAAAAPTGAYAMSTAVALHIKEIPSLGMTGYNGTWGRASTGSGGGSDQSDFSDPDGVQNYVSVATKNSQTSGINAPVVYDARADLNTLFTGPSLISGGPKIISLATLQNYARCAPTAQAQATSYTVASTAFGKTLTPGTPLTVDVTGAELGLSKVTAGTVTVLLENIKETDGDQSAAARTVITMTGDFKTTDGGTYTGELATMVLGDVRVNCATEVGPTTAPTTVPPTETASPSVSPSPSPSVSPTDTSSPSPSDSINGSPTPTVSPTSSPSVSPTVSPTGSPSVSPRVSPRVSPSATATGYGPLPVTGSDLEVLGGFAGLFVAVGAALVTGARKSRR
jgi:hypothetical protein